MKNLIAFLTILIATALTSCADHSDDMAETPASSDSAALNLYYKYADDENLTVAYLGDFSLNGNKIDALMIQATFDEDWNQLKNDFGMLPKLDSLCDDPNCNLSVNSEDQKVISIGVGIDTDFIEELGLDTITDLSQVDEERFGKMAETIAEKIKGIVSNFPMQDTSLPTDAVIVGDGPLEFVDADSLNMETYINILAEAIGKNLLNEVLVKNGAIPDDQSTIPDGLVFPDSTMRSARDYGHRGYISAADNGSRTLWLFFYDDQEECNNILTHIKDDILVGQQQ